jgi:hypothetical protein
MKFKFLIILFLILFKSFSQERDLNFYIQKAQTNSPLLSDLKNQIKSNSIDSLVFRATRKPQISGNLYANYAPLLDSIGKITRNVNESLIYFISTRLRPKLMTALGAIIALLPLAIGVGTGSELHQPLAIAVIGGFLIALPLLLIVLPSFLSYGYKNEKHFKHMD